MRIFHVLLSALIVALTLVSMAACVSGLSAQTQPSASSAQAEPSTSPIALHAKCADQGFTHAASEYVGLTVSQARVLAARLNETLIEVCADEKPILRTLPLYDRSVDVDVRAGRIATAFRNK